MGDLFAGLLILDQHAWLGLVFHLLAFLTWNCGMMVAGQASTAANVIGLLMFPGIGLPGWTLGVVGSSLLQAIRKIFRKRMPNSEEAHLSPAYRNLPGLTRPRVSEPVEAIAQSADTTAKHQALVLLSREPSASSCRMARKFLMDTDQDVRAQAALTVSQIEFRLNERVRSVLASIKRQPQNPEHYAALGRIYCEYARGSEADSMNRKLYFGQALEAFEKSVLLDDSRPDNLIELAEASKELGNYTQAWNAAMRILGGHPDDSSGYLLAMEIALREHRYDRINALAKQACLRLPPDDQKLPIMKRWLSKEEVHANA